MKRTCFSLLAALSLLLGCSGTDPEKTDENTSGNNEENVTPSTDPVKAGKVTVAVFSFTGNTKAVASTLAGITGGTLYEIIPEEAYGQENNNYYDESTRAWKEQNGPATARPAIKKTLGGVSDCDVLLLGFPIWYGKVPRVVLTFLNEYSFSGKTVIPFITSGGSGIAGAATELKSTYPDITWKDGDRLNGKTKEQLEQWLKGLGVTNSNNTDMSKIKISAGGKSITATLSDNSSAKAFAEKLAEGAVTVEMADYGNFEKVGPLGFSLPQNDESITTVPGDIILYQGNQITIYYDANTWTFTRLGKVDGLSQSELKSFLGTGSITVTFSLQ